MTLTGYSRNGAIVLDGDATLPEGTPVIVSIPIAAPAVAPSLPETEIVCKPGKLPYVRGGIPGTLHLTNEMIAAIFEEEEIESLRKQGAIPDQTQTQS